MLLKPGALRCARALLLRLRGIVAAPSIKIVTRRVMSSYPDTMMVCSSGIVFKRASASGGGAAMAVRASNDNVSVAGRRAW